MASLSGFETAYQELLLQWLDEQIADVSEQIASGAALTAGDVGIVALQYAGAVQRIQALRDVREQCRDIHDKLNGE